MADSGDNATDDERLRLLAATARRGDRVAAADLLRAVQDTIFRFAIAQLHDPEAAGEATQETGLRLLKALPGYEGRSRVTTWVLGIALNVCREHRRRRTESNEPEPINTAAGSERTGDDQLLHDEDRQAVQAALASLPPRQREAVTLRYFEGLSVADTAEAMGCTAGAAKASVWQALRRLRTMLSEKEPNP